MDNENDIDFDTLPDSLIFKANNGEGKGTNLIVHDLKRKIRRHCVAFSAGGLLANISEH